MGLCVNKYKSEDPNSDLTIQGWISSSPFRFDLARNPQVMLRSGPISPSSNLLLFDDNGLALVPLESASQEQLSNGKALISKRQSCLEVNPCEGKEEILVSVSSMNDMGTSKASVSEGDTFVLGGVRMFVRSLNFSSSDDIYQMMNDSMAMMSEAKLREAPQIFCRICHSEESDFVRNPLLAPCLCSGSMKYIHLGCLRKQAETRNFTKMKSLFTISFDLRALVCDVCLSPFPETIIQDDVPFSLIDEEKLNPPFLVFELFDSKGRRKKTIHCLKLTFGSKVVIGSSQSSDIRLLDRSISPVHACLLIKSKGMFIEDRDSHLGTYKVFPSVKIHEKFNNFAICFADLLLRVVARDPAPCHPSDLPPEEAISFRFSKILYGSGGSPKHHESILEVDFDSSADEASPEAESPGRS